MNTKNETYYKSDCDQIGRLAERVVEIVNQPEMHQRRQCWERHNRLEQGRPLVLVYPEGAWDELLPTSVLTCKGILAREIEWKLLNLIYHYENFHDDMVFEGSFYVPKEIKYSTFTPDRTTYSTNTFHFHTVLAAPVYHSELNPVAGFIPRLWCDKRELLKRNWASTEIITTIDDLKECAMPMVEYCQSLTYKRFEAVKDLIGDNLKVELKGITHCSFHLASVCCDVRGGMTNLMMDLYDKPKFIHSLLEFLTQSGLNLINQYHQQGLLSLNNHNEIQSTGGLSYTAELPSEGYTANSVRPCDMWASAESQELSSVSPAMLNEFMIPYLQRLLEPFGLSGYGCCEALEDRIDIIRKLPHLRRISCSPFAEPGRFAEEVKDNYIMSWKQNPNMISSGFEQNYLRKYIRNVLEAAKKWNCILEIILKDTMHCDGHPERFTEWTNIVQDEISKYWD